MDEFTSIGQVDIIAKSASYMAGYNMRLFPIIQSVAQLDATYGKEMSRTLMTNHALQIIFPPREQRDAEVQRIFPVIPLVLEYKEKQYLTECYFIYSDVYNRKQQELVFLLYSNTNDLS